MDEYKVVAIDQKDWHFSVSKNFVTNKKLSIGARLLLVILRSYVGYKQDSCFPGRDHLCSVMGVTKDTLTKWVAELKEHHHLRVEQQKSKTQFSRNVYFTSFEPCPSFSDTTPPDTTDSPLRLTITEHLPSSEERVPLPKKPDAASLQRRELSDAWISAYSEAFKEPYSGFKTQATRDGRALNTLLSLNLPAPEIIALAKRAWANPDGFWCKKSTTLSGFAEKLEEIKQELRIKEGFRSITPAQPVTVRKGGWGTPYETV